MSPASKRLPAKKAGARKKKQQSGAWLRWWPLVLGIVLVPVAVRAVDILALTGPWGARALVPWTFLLQGRILHLPQDWADYLVEGLLYAQFPVYGVLLMLLHRRLRYGTAALVILGSHIAAFLALFAIATS